MERQCLPTGRHQSGRSMSPPSPRSPVPTTPLDTQITSVVTLTTFATIPGKLPTHSLGVVRDPWLEIKGEKVIENYFVEACVGQDVLESQLEKG